MKLFVKNLLFTILIPGTVAVYVPLLISHGKIITSYPLLLMTGMVLLAAGAVVYLRTVWDFAIAGKGTPLPIDAPKKLVVIGLYRYMRNPMYVGVLMVILGWTIIFTDWWLMIYGLGVWIVVHLFITAYEEPRLQQLFGTEYENYRRSVGRWIPRHPKRTI
jgi:protein-S-isoprenylcysteine O-methyltransferase Ste14